MKASGAASRHPELRIRRPLVRPSADAVRVLRLVRGLPRHALLLGAFLLVLCVARVWLRLETVNLGYEHIYQLDGLGKNAIKFRFDVVNVFDEKYVIRSGSGIGVGAPQFGQRLSFYAGVTYAF